MRDRYSLLFLLLFRRKEHIPVIVGRKHREAGIAHISVNVVYNKAVSVVACRQIDKLYHIVAAVGAFITLGFACKVTLAVVSI